MRRIAVLLGVMAALTGAVADGAAQEGLGVGIIIGEPTGVSVKSWLSTRTAFDLAAAWSFVNEDALHLHGDYLVHNYSLFSVDRGLLPFYYGIGARLKTQNSDSRVGIRFPLGASYMFATEPVDIFLEVVPILDVTPSTDFNLNASLGARYFFR